MIWNGKTISTAGDLFDAAASCTTQQQADEFLTAYRAHNEHADQNLGYIIGYGDDATRNRLYGLFRLNHPVFGRVV
jgi:hypothetical protein